MSGKHLSLLFVFVLSALAQEFRATVTGRVTDPSGSAVPNAKVIAQNVQSNEETAATSGEDGSYTIPFLRPGTYTVRAEAQGFKTIVRENIELFVSDRKTVDIEMEVGAIGESVTVTAEAPLLDEATATRGGGSRNCRSTAVTRSCCRT